MLRERTSGIPGAVDKRESRKDGMGTNVIGLGQRKGNIFSAMQFINFQYLDKIENNCLYSYKLKYFWHFWHLIMRIIEIAMISYDHHLKNNNVSQFTIILIGCGPESNNLRHLSHNLTSDQHSFRYWNNSQQAKKNISSN